MNTVQISIWSLVAALILFVAISVVLFAQALRPDAEEREARKSRSRRPFRDRISAYVGPAGPHLALLSPVKRVALELVSASCGFPGFGWMMSGRVAVGLPLMILGSGFVFGFYPVFLAFTGHFLDSPYVALQYLPAVGIVSAATLGVTEYRFAHRRLSSSGDGVEA